MPAPRPCDTASTRQPAGVARKHAEAKEKKGRMGAQFLVRATSLLSEQCHTSALAVRCPQIGAIGSSAPSFQVAVLFFLGVRLSKFFPCLSRFLTCFRCFSSPLTLFLPFSLHCHSFLILLFVCLATWFSKMWGRAALASNWGIYGCHVANVYTGGNSYVLTTELRNGPERTCGLKLCATLV